MADASRLDGKVVIITGGGRGFGRELALAFTGAGARVVITAARGREELERTVAAANTVRDGACAGIVADAASPADADRVAAFAADRFGHVDVLINNAARGPADAMPRYDIADPLPFWQADPVRYGEVVATNVTGPFLMARALVPSMVEHGFGRIVNVSTSRPTMIRRGAGPYGACKAALEASSVVWAQDLAGTGVTVNVLLPGAASDTALIPGDGVGTRSMPAFRPGSGEPGDVGRMPGLLPADILVAPALWLASAASAGWTGRRLVAKDWDPTLPGEVAAARAASPPHHPPTIM